MDQNLCALRVLWLEDGNCILFNSAEKKVSAICPPELGHIAQKAASGTALSDAIREAHVSLKISELAQRLIPRIVGNAKKPTAPLLPEEERFYRTLTLAPTSTCSLRCVYCSGDAGERSSVSMDWQLAKDSIDYFFAHCYGTGPYTLQFHGAGEPMNAPEIVFQAVEYARGCAAAKDSKLLTRISTNGVLPNAHAQWLGQNMDHISLSLDGPPELHNLQRPMKNGGGSYDSVIRSLKIFRQTGALKRINMVVTNESLDTMEDTLRHIHSLCNNIQVRILPMEYCGRCEKTGQAPVERTAFNTRFSSALKSARDLGMNVLTASEQMTYYTEHYCQACGYAMCVTPQGAVSTCVEAMDEREPGTGELFIGHYKKALHTFEIEWDKVARLRGRRTFHHLKQCRDCSFRSNCAGNCLIRAARKNGTVFSVDADACRTVKAVLTEQLTEIASKDMNKENGYIEKAVSFAEMQDKSRTIFREFEKINQKPWGIEAALMELSKQLGDLTKRILMQEGYYLPSRADHPKYHASAEQIGNELADMLHWLIWIADYYHISLPDAHRKAREAELGYINAHRPPEK